MNEMTVTILKSEFDRLLAANAKLTALNVELQQRVFELETKIRLLKNGRDSDTSV